MGEKITRKNRVAQIFVYCGMRFTKAITTINNMKTNKYQKKPIITNLCNRNW